MTTIPVLAPPPAAILTQPYLTPDAFRAYPTWLDLDNLIPGGVEALQEGELADVLLAASNACITLDDGSTMRLDAHYVQNEDKQVPAGAGGRITLKPRDVPIRAITSLSYGWDPSAMVADSLPNPSGWFTDGRIYSFRPGAAPMAFTGPPIQFGPRYSAGGRVFVTWSYLAGFPSTTLSAPVAQGASSITVADPTGILPGDPVQLLDVGKTEAVTVASGYQPAIPSVPPAPASIPLAAPAASAHDSGVMATGMPRAILQAVICFAVAYLMREDVSEETPASTAGISARTTDEARGGQAGGLINDALGYLRAYRPTWRP